MERDQQAPQTAPALPAQRHTVAPSPAPPEGTPLSEAPFTDASAQGAANVVQTYFALIKERKFADAARLWYDAEQPDGMSGDAFAASFAQYREFHAEVFTPGKMEGAAGSIYVDVPARIYGALRTGAPLDRKVFVSLRRVNNVDGSTAEQRRWHIFRIGDAAD
jgi:hypothetical protein